MDKQTKVQEIQALLYRLFNTILFSLKGKEMQEGDNLPAVFISKAEMLEAALQILNSFGEELSKDPDLKEL